MDFLNFLSNSVLFKHSLLILSNNLSIVRSQEDSMVGLSKKLLFFLLEELSESKKNEGDIFPLFKICFFLFEAK